MSSLNRYEIKIKNFNTKTPCDGFYVLTGLTDSIIDADYIDGEMELLPIEEDYIFDVIVGSTVTHIYVFIVHCDGLTDPKLQGGYQLTLVKLDCPETEE
jgi:hypothetical protein